jgi:hypothetical protein
MIEAARWKQKILLPNIENIKRSAFWEIPEKQTKGYE